MIQQLSSKLNTCNTANPLLGSLWRRNKSIYPHAQAGLQMFIGALFAIKLLGVIEMFITSFVIMLSWYTYGVYYMHQNSANYTF
jgi:hypothetical protein